ncbi:Transmembrane emp24 domain-containing protein 10, partial [Microtus ochrogaster]
NHILSRSGHTLFFTAASGKFAFATEDYGVFDKCFEIQGTGQRSDQPDPRHETCSGVKNEKEVLKMEKLELSHQRQRFATQKACEKQPRVVLPTEGSEGEMQEGVYKPQRPTLRHHHACDLAGPPALLLQGQEVKH